MAMRCRHISSEATILQKLKDGLLRLLENQGFEEFKDVPVESFKIFKFFFFLDSCMVRVC